MQTLPLALVEATHGSAAGTASVFIDLGLAGVPMIVGFVAAPRRR